MLPYCIYVLLSRKDRILYHGFTTNLEGRLKDHAAGRTRSTRSRRPLILIHSEYYIVKTDAVRRERYFKTAQGRRMLKLLLRDTLVELKYRPMIKVEPLGAKDMKESPNETIWNKSFNWEARKPGSRAKLTSWRESERSSTFPPRDLSHLNLDGFFVRKLGREVSPEPRRRERSSTSVPFSKCWIAFPTKFDNLLPLGVNQGNLCLLKRR